MQRYTKLLTNVRINPVIRVMIASDIFILSAFGLLGPIFAIFVLEQIKGGSAEVAGFASMVWLLSRAIFQLPIAVFIDRRKGERDDFLINFCGSVGVSLVPLAYLFVSLPIHLYLVQALYGLMHALAYPAWLAIFTRHIDPHKEGLEWAVFDISVDLGTALAAGVGGVVAVIFGFKVLFIAVSFFSLVGSLLLLKNYPLMRTGREGECRVVCENPE